MTGSPSTLITPTTAFQDLVTTSHASPNIPLLLFLSPDLAIMPSPRRKNTDTAKTPLINETPVSSSSSSSDAALEERVLEVIKGPSFVVDWYGPSDVGNPQNLPRWRKWLITMSVALYVLTTTFASSVFSAAAGVTAIEFGVGVETMVGAGTSMFMLGFAVGSIIFG